MRRPSSATFSRPLVSRFSLLAAAGVVALFSLHPGAQAPARPAPDATGRTLSLSTPHLTLSATVAPLQLARGGRLVLTADVTPKAGMHLYAPGARYRVVAIKLAPNSPFKLEEPVTYPKSSVYTFKPLNEDVPVYDAPFRLEAHVTLDESRPLVTPLRRPLPVTLKATFDYQACDNRYCYLPESVPLRWTITSTP